MKCQWVLVGVLVGVDAPSVLVVELISGGSLTRRERRDQRDGTVTHLSTCITPIPAQLCTTFINIHKLTVQHKASGGVKSSCLCRQFRMSYAMQHYSSTRRGTPFLTALDFMVYTPCEQVHLRATQRRLQKYTLTRRCPTIQSGVNTVITANYPAQHSNHSTDLEASRNMLDLCSATIMLNCSPSLLLCVP
jgi:hypothetical protein